MNMPINGLHEITLEELQDILERHKHFLNRDCDDWMEMNAILRGCRLSQLDLSNVDLSYVFIENSILDGVDLSCANLQYATIHRSLISNTCFYLADLRYANLENSYFRDSYLVGTKLVGANVYYCTVSDVIFDSQSKSSFYPLICPEVGEFIGWKKVEDDLIVKLRIPDRAMRSSAYGRKCRCSEAEVLAIEYPDGHNYEKDQVSSMNDPDFIYTVGKTVSVKDYDTNRWHECSEGIHFFITRQEAVNFNL